MKRIILISILLLFSINNCMLAQKSKKGSGYNLKSINGSPALVKININNISTYVNNNGKSDYTPTGDSGFQYPKGSGKTVFFTSGPLWGGMTGNYWAVGGATYLAGLLPGRILPNSTAEDMTLPHVRIYRVRSDYKNCGTESNMKNFFASEIADENRTGEEIFNQYDLDWKEWPAQYGAPYIDKDKNGVYDPEKDIPGMSELPSQTIWYVANDLSEAATQYLYGSLPLKLEMQATVWGYKTDGPEGNTIYKRYRIINRSGKQIDSMYLCIWSDPDLGGAFDDFAGCDTTLSLGYVYNGVGYDDIYKLTPPAGGYVLLQSPHILGNANDIAKIDHRVIQGRKNIGMTGFYVGLKSLSADWGDPYYNDYTNGALRIKNLFQIKLLVAGTPVIDPVTQKSTKYPLSGDPVNKTGWYDGLTWNKGDRRMGLVSGSFTMNPNDTQQIVVAQIAAGGSGNVDNLNAVLMLKHYSKAISYKWEHNVEPANPVSPQVSVSELNEQIILNWYEQSAYAECEKDLNSAYKFQGYNVYQMPSVSATKNDAEIIATYDINDNKTLIYDWVEDAVKGYLEYRVVADGTNSGIKRFCTITNDAVRNNLPLYNFSKYYFGVKAYYAANDPGAIPQMIESPLQVIMAMPQGTLPGIRINAALGDELHPVKQDISDATASAQVIDPSRVTGHNYEIYFKNNWYKQLAGIWVPITDTAGVKEPAQLRNEWFLKDLTLGTDVLTNQTVYDGIDAVTGRKEGLYTSNADGLRINITGSFNLPNSFKDITLNGVEGFYPVLTFGRFIRLGFDIADARVLGGHGGTALEATGKGTNDPLLLQDDIELRFAGEYETVIIGGKKVKRVKSGGQIATLYGAGNYSLANHPLNPNPGSNNPFLIRVPFEVWDYYNNRQINLRIFHAEGSTADTLFKVWNDAGRMDFEIVPTDYAETVIADNSPALNLQTWKVLMYKSQYTPGDVIQLKFSNPIIPGITRFTFTAPAVTQSPDFAKEDADKINVFPNPYYGANPQELNRYQRFVTFTHLPERAVIKIFNVSGQLIRILEKDDAGQVMRWNLATDGNLIAPSGIYVARIELPGIGKVKILKFAIIQEQQYPLHY